MDCIFCKVASGEIPAQVVYQDERVLAFRDVNPGAPVHILIVPKRHIPGVMALTESDEGLVGHIVLTAKKLAVENGLSERGFRVVVNSGPDAGQSVPHLHFHLLGGREMSWPPG
ncbi:MAG: histidine triad nucleotide-binding protein [Armatimonadota bacterium]